MRRSIAAGFVLFLIAHPALADTIYVSDACGDDSWAGISPVCQAPDGPKKTIQAGIDALAAKGGRVLVANGTYTGFGNKNLTLGGVPVALKSTNGPDDCIIDCENDGRALLLTSSENIESVIDGFTIINGSAADGAGIFCAADLTIRNCRIRDCNASSDGGAINGNDSRPTITDCVITGNSARFGGGIAYCDGIIEGCTILSNVTLQGGAGLVGCDGIIRRCQISYNHAAAHGGGLALCSAVVSDCTIRGNTSFNGAGVYCDDNAIVLRNCRLIENSAHANGGGVYAVARNVTMLNCTVVGNRCNRAGGGVYLFGGGTHEFVNCTFSRNVGVTYGGGLLNDGASSTLTNCVFWSNAAAFGANVAVTRVASNQSSILTCAYSDVQGGEQAVYQRRGTLIWGLGNIDADPQFAFADDAHLTVSSPCIDAGTNDALVNLPATDVDGNSRAIDGDGNGTVTIDIGAFEFNPDVASIAFSPPRLVFFIAEGDPGVSQQTLSIRNATGATLNWDIASAAGWLEVTPASGASTGEIDDILVRVSAAGLPHGEHASTLIVSDLNAINSPRSVPVILRVTRTLRVPAEFATIQDGIDATLVDGDTVLVADGVYTGARNKDLDFRGKNIVVRSEGGPELCAIDCEGAGRGFLFQSGENHGATVDGFTIRNGSERFGGGILCTGSSPTIVNCVIHGCVVTVQGGGIACSRGAPVIDGCAIFGNTSVRDGGGLSLDHANAIVRNCTISSNQVTGNAYGGGGVSCELNAPLITGCTITSNTGPNGGGFILRESDATIDNCEISNNIGAGIRANDARNAIIRNCTIRANSNRGLTCDGSNAVSLIDCTVSDNTSTGNGGGLFRVNGLIQNCTISGNVAENGGGLTQCGAPIVGCTFVDNHANDRGGAIYDENGNYSIEDCVFRLNTAANEGGAIYLDVDSLTVQHTNFEENAASAGGGMYLNNTTTTIRNTVFVRNRAWSGAGVFSSAGTAIIDNCVFRANDGTIGAGLMSNRNHTVRNSLFEGNSATDSGGGISCHTDLNTRILNCVIIRNTAGQDAGGIGFWGFGGSGAVISSCIVRNNAAPGNPEIGFTGAAVSVTYCNVLGGWPGGGCNIDDNPSFADPANGDYHLSAGSPCIDTGNPDTFTAGQVDLDGEPRVMRGRVDMGIDEFTGRPFVFGDMNCDGVRNGADIDPFFLGLGDPAVYGIQFPNCERMNGDMNGDGAFNGADIDAFFTFLGGGVCP